MKKKTCSRAAFLLVGCLLVFGLPLYAGGEKEAPAPKGEAAAATGKPQYGGTISPFSHAGLQKSDPASPDIEAGVYAGLMWLDFIQESPLIGDIEKYGPRGNGEYAFQTFFYIPYEYLTGGLCESWELTLEKITYKVRKGIHWAADNVDWMDNRELTAEDIAADMNVFLHSMWGSRFDGHIKKIYAQGDTVVVEIDEYSSNLLYWWSHEDRALVSPPEMIKAGADKWENQVGTGPWMFDEYVIGSHMRYKRNPNYWKSTTIDGQTYKLPFVDNVLMPIIPDVSTQMAALQTGKLDMYRDVPAPQWDMLDRVAKNLKKAALTKGTGQGVWLRCDQPPFGDVMVRRAMMAGTNRADFAKLANAEDLPQTDWWPILPGHPTHTPLSELPADIQKLWDYNPDLAKKMLADAGYPDGFKTTMLVESTPANLDRAALLKDQWEKIGVVLDLDVKDQASYTKAFNVWHPDPPPPKWEGAALATAGVNANPLSAFTITWVSDGVTNNIMWYNDEFDDLINRAGKELDVAKQNVLVKKAGRLLAPEFTHIPFNLDPTRIYWWPWIKNYYGELTINDDATWAPVLKYVWLDQNLKKEMGF